ncbi:MAG: hypothetical protein Q8Q23_01100 [bacterium]|nr:hypothetical protein [bacterium]
MTEEMYQEMQREAYGGNFIIAMSMVSFFVVMFIVVLATIFCF